MKVCISGDINNGFIGALNRYINGNIFFFRDSCLFRTLTVPTDRKVTTTYL